MRLLKNKNIALLIGFVLVLLLCYTLAISKTLKIRREYLSLKQEEQQFNNLTQQLTSFHKKEVYLDSVLQSANLGNTSIENNLLRVVNQEADNNNLKVMDFNPPHVYELDGTIYKTFNFLLRGNFIDILKTLHSIEMQSSFGEIIHVDFSKQRNHRTNQSYLEATVFIQKLE